ncbi:MAG: branched-chain amino acid ABC transporter permease [Candidatus Bathyarchaeia archaeon]
MLELFAPTLISGFILGAVYGLATMGLNLIFGVMNLTNFAHGDFLALGAYSAFWLWTLLGLNPIASIPVSAFIGLVVGLLIFYVLINRLVFSPDAALVTTYALGIFLEEVMRILWTPLNRGIPWSLGSIQYTFITLPITYIVTFIAGVIAILAIYFIMYKTYFGKSLRAVISDSKAAASCGVNVKTTLAYGFALGVALAFIGGTLLIVYNPSGITPYFGQTYMLNCFVIAILGGLGNPWGALLGGLIFGELEQFLPLILNYFPQIEQPYSFTPFICFTIFIIVLLIRPQGILGGRK